VSPLRYLSKSNIHVLVALTIFITAIILLLGIGSCEAPAPSPGTTQTAPAPTPAPAHTGPPAIPDFSGMMTIDFDKLLSSIVVYGDWKFEKPAPKGSMFGSITYQIKDPFYFQIAYNSVGAVGTGSLIYQRAFKECTLVLNASYDQRFEEVDLSDISSEKVDGTIGRVGFGAQINSDSYIMEMDAYFPVTQPIIIPSGSLTWVLTPHGGVSGFFGVKIKTFEYNNIFYVSPTQSNGRYMGNIGWIFYITDNIFINTCYGDAPDPSGASIPNVFMVTIGFDGGLENKAKVFTTPYLYRSQAFNYSLTNVY